MAIKAGRVGIHPSQVDPITGMLTSGPSGSTNYNDLSNKPQINGVTLSGNKTTSDLHIEAGASDLTDLDDVTISNPEAGQLLIYDGDKWENQFASISPVTPATLASLQDVLISSPASGQTLEYDADDNKWVNVYASISPLSLAQLRDVEITDLQDGDFITYDSTSEKWINTGEAPAPTYTDLTATIYGAVEDTISFTDAAGISHSEVFASGQSSKSVTFKINPSGSTSITFTSAVAKNPDDLFADYSKTVTITDATTEIKVMPSNALYWYGYVDSNLENFTSDNGWGQGGISGFPLPTYSTNHLICDSQGSGKASGVGCSSIVTGNPTLKAIAQGVSGTAYAYMGGSTNKADVSLNNEYQTLSSTSVTLLSQTFTKNSEYAWYQSQGGASSKLYALWYE